MDNNHMNYIATWFYKESKEEASFYPQLGRKGDSSLLHSIYMQIQVPFFVTFRHFNPDTKLLFFTNLYENELPYYLREIIKKADISVISIPYSKRPPKNWHNAWQNQFYLFDILEYMGNIMNENDSLIVCDADCVCNKALNDLFNDIHENGSALYEFNTDRNITINGITLPEMDSFYHECFNERPVNNITYYGGEFIGLRKDYIKKINDIYNDIWKFNLYRKENGMPKLNEEAHFLSIMAERLHFRNNIANRYVKRMWTSPMFNNITPEDKGLHVWHLPYEKKRGLRYLYLFFKKHNYEITNEEQYFRLSGIYNGIPQKTIKKRIYDRVTTVLQRIGISD